MGISRRTIALLAASSTAGCGIVLGIGDVPAVVPLAADAGHDGSLHDAGLREADVSLAPATDGRPDAPQPLPDALPDAISDAVACRPVTTPEAGIADGACPVTADVGSCMPMSVSTSALAWVPPVAPKRLCTEQQIKSLFSPGTLEHNCFDCLVSFAGTGESAFGATINFPQVTYAVYGVPNFGGCIATLEPCNLACAKAIQAADLCINEACLGGCPDVDAAYGDLQTCVQNAGRTCPCAGLLEAADTCTAEIAARGSPAIVCLGNGQTGLAGYESQVEAIGEVLCGGLDAGAVDAH